MRKKIKIIFWIILTMTIIWILWSLFSHRMPWQIPDEKDKQLTVLTFNTQGMAVTQQLDKKLEMIQYINSLDADIVCLQEVTVYKAEGRLTLPMLREAMNNYPYTYYDFKLYNSERQFGNVVFSRYPLINKETIRFPSRTNISSQCDVLAHGDTIRLMINHLESFHINKDDLIFNESSSDTDDTSLIRKLLRASRLRHRQVTALQNAIDKSPYPVVAVGDFNSLPISLVYWRMNWDMRDCFAECSFGRYGSTFHQGSVHARIDYVFVSPSLTPIACDVYEEEYSDHDPLVCTIGW